VATIPRTYVDGQLFAPTDAYFWAVDNRPLWVLMRAMCAVDDEVLDILTYNEEVITFNIGTVAVEGAGFGGIYQSLLGGTITRVNFSQGAQGSSGNTIVNAYINGVTMFTTSSNRPSLAFNASPAIVQQTVIENATVPANGNITWSVDAVQAGAPLQGRLDIFLRRGITARNYMQYSLSGEAPSISIIYTA
jgi:hypothetical protein